MKVIPLYHIEGDSKYHYLTRPSTGVVTIDNKNILERLHAYKKMKYGDGEKKQVTYNENGKVKYIKNKQYKIIEIIYINADTYFEKNKIKIERI